MNAPRLPTRREDPSGEHVPHQIGTYTWACMFDGYDWPCPFLIRSFRSASITFRCRRCNEQHPDYEQAARCYDSHSFRGRSPLDSYACV